MPPSPSRKSSLTQEQLLRQRLLPQQVRFGEFLEKTDEEMAREVELELELNPALERVDSERGDRAGLAHEQPARASWQRDTRPDTDDYTPVQAEAGPTLREALLQQLAESDLPEPTRRLASYIVDAIDSNGYLTRTLPQIADDIALAAPGGEPIVTTDELRPALAAVRALDPAGVAAFDLRDTLLLQLQRLPAARPARAEAIEIVTHFFDVYSRRNDRKLAELSGLTPEAIAGAHALITSLNPRPGSAFIADPTQAMGHAGVTPDFIVETDGERISVVMPDTVPDLRLEESFVPDPARQAVSDPAREFIRARRADALTFIDLLQRRRQLLMRIMRAIIDIQAPFFLNGDDDAAMRPMVLRQIAEAVGADISMVSRAVSGKWVATDLGIYPLKHFFNHRGAADGDDSTSAHAILAAMRDIVDSEPHDAPLSDDAIAAALAGRGYKVARRTVAKYRSRLNIAPARLRRR